MASRAFGPNDLLLYDARFRVLICRECQYAIQKSAISSHLLRHKIYRDERQNLLTSISRIEILEPEDVPLPAPDSEPISLLPIIDGYCCTSHDCDYLCASEKRMRRHWSEVHGDTSSSILSNGARYAKLQTFFRGTKLRYFEVTAVALPEESGAELLPISSMGSNDAILVRIERRQAYDSRASDCTTSSLQEPVSVPPRLSNDRSTISIDLETLNYFNHFMNTTSLTLPGPQTFGRPTHYWQTDAVLEALHQEWLMYGLLAICAGHMAIVSRDSTTEYSHHQRYIQLSEDFEYRRRAEMRCGKHPGQDAMIAGERVRHLSQLTRKALFISMEGPNIAQQPAMPFHLQSFLADIRNLGVDAAAVHVSNFQINNDNFKDTFARATQTLSSMGSMDDESSALMNQLLTLPTRMTEAFGRPDDIQDVLATLSAIAALVEIVSLSYSSSAMDTTFQAMAMWLLRVPDRFNNMILQNNPAAIVVVSYWVLLVKRAEDCGSWFLRGAATTISQEIARQLSADDVAIQSLISN